MVYPAIYLLWRERTLAQTWARARERDD